MDILIERLEKLLSNLYATYSLEICNMEIYTIENVQEKKHQVQKAIAEIERKERAQHQHAKQSQLNRTMRSILMEQMDVA